MTLHVRAMACILVIIAVADLNPCCGDDNPPISLRSRPFLDAPTQRLADHLDFLATGAWSVVPSDNAALKISVLCNSNGKRTLCHEFDRDLVKGREFSISLAIREVGDNDFRISIVDDSANSRTPARPFPIANWSKGFRRALRDNDAHKMNYNEQRVVLGIYYAAKWEGLPRIVGAGKLSVDEASIEVAFTTVRTNRP